MNTSQNAALKFLWNEHFRKNRGGGLAAARHSSLATSTILLLLCFFLSSCSPKPFTLAILHATIIDGTGAPPLPDTTVLIRGQEITAIGPSASFQVPSEAATLDAAGKFLIPGLADMHVHLTAAGEPAGSRDFVIPLLIANGVTTVRDMGGEVELLRALRSEIARDSIFHARLHGPQIFFTGPYLDGDPPNFKPTIVVKNAAEATAAVDQLVSQGVDFLKVQSVLSRDAYFAIAAESKKKGIRFVGHVPDSVSAFEAAAAGQSSIEHLTGILLACSSQEKELRAAQTAPPNLTPQQAQARDSAWQRKLLETQSPEKTDALLSAFVAQQTWQVPTFPILARLAFMTPATNPTNDPRMKYVPPNEKKVWQEGISGQLDGQTESDFALRREIVSRSLAIVAKMQQSGVRIIAGTDTPAPNVFPGSSLHEDLAYLVQAGLTPMQALQAATKNPAEFLNQLNTRGTIAPNKIADLVLLDANPLTDIHNTQKIRAVILRGWLFDRVTLDAILYKVAWSAREK